MKEKDFRRLSAQKVVDFFNASPYATRNNLLVTEGDFLYVGGCQNSRLSSCFFRLISDDRMLYEVETDMRTHVVIVRRYECRSNNVLKGY